MEGEIQAAWDDGADGPFAVRYAARVARQPPFDFGMFAGGVVVQDQVQVKVFRRISVQLFEESEPFHVSMPRLGTRNDFAIYVIGGGDRVVP